MSRTTLAVLLGSLLLASASGFLVATAVGSSAQQATRTETITLRNGATGPRGPTGPAGAVSCPAGFEEGELVVNHPGGQVTLFTCLKARR